MQDTLLEMSEPTDRFQDLSQIRLIHNLQISTNNSTTGFILLIFSLHSPIRHQTSTPGLQVGTPIIRGVNPCYVKSNTLSLLRTPNPSSNQQSSLLTHCRIDNGIQKEFYIQLMVFAVLQCISYLNNLFTVEAESNTVIECLLQYEVIQKANL